MIAALISALTIAGAPPSAPLVDDSTAHDAIVLDTLAVGPRIAERWSVSGDSLSLLLGLAATVDSVRRRPRAIETSDWYARRLTIHRYASYTMPPLFAVQYVLGQRLLNQKRDQLVTHTRLTPIDPTLRRNHRLAVAGISTLFTVNTVTGLWNLYDSRKAKQGRGQRIVHATTMLLADAGFVATGILGNRATNHGYAEARTHRNVALASMGVSLGGASLMWFFHRD